jgi:hypothetical protein
VGGAAPPRGEADEHGQRAHHDGAGPDPSGPPRGRQRSAGLAEPSHERARGHDGGGEIRIETGLDPVRAGQLRLVLADTGPGIATAHRPHLFEPFC